VINNREKQIGVDEYPWVSQGKKKKQNEEFGVYFFSFFLAAEIGGDFFPLFIRFISNSLMFQVKYSHYGIDFDVIYAQKL
jgi:hypothetical protein